MNRKQWLGALLATAVLSSLVTALAAAHLKGGAKTVDRMAPKLNQSLHRLMSERKLGLSQPTRVVPVLKFENGACLGAAQVTGAAEQLAKVKAVVQLEGSFSSSTSGTSSSSHSSSGNGTSSNSSTNSSTTQIDLRALVPITSRTVANAGRVPGVAVSGLVEIEL